ncbi:YopX family protein [Lactiplantibacillus plantarum]|uniref:YopX family protein n=1 Tax=Lactiplantibacillus plantarum TaxID=1590 RepID=UPI001FF09316|nr:YopX family protein [Lactiplantibacillus plantarum]
MIKFRAWDKRTECYLYDIQDAYDTLSGFVKYDDGENADYDEDCFGAFLNNKRYDVEQFTGLKDVNGKDIYEGDIVHILSINVISDIKYMRDGVTPEFEIDRQKVFDEENVLGTATCESDVEIIGNVHANPELLKG